MSTSATLLLRLEGPLQSWGYRSRFKDRDTGLEPTKSGVIGMLCCALGRDRAEALTDLASLKMHVRVDRQGSLLTDFHTAGGGTFRGSTGYFAPTSSGGKGKNPVIVEKRYLMDASFVVALHGDVTLLEKSAESLQDPVWPLSLGRKSCPPSCPVFMDLSSSEPGPTLLSAPRSQRCDAQPRIIWETEALSDKTEIKNDVPTAWPDRLTREYKMRFTESQLGRWPE